MCHFLTKDSFCPAIWTKLPLIDVQHCVNAREAALGSAVLQCCHVLILTSTFRHVVWSSHKDRYFMKLIKWSVVDMRYMTFLGVIKHKAFGCFSVFCACPCLLLFFSMKIWQHWHFTAGLMSAASPVLRLLSLFFPFLASHIQTKTLM